MVDAVARTISRHILDGTYPPGSRLPSVRALAEAHDVNVSTIQRVLAQLEERRLVRAHDRSGVEVRDVRRSGGTSTWPLVLERASVDPGPAVELLRDALAIRRMLAAEVLRGIAARPREEYEATLRSAMETLAEEVARDEPSPDRLLEADCEVLRTLLVAARRPAILGILNDLQSMIAATPVLVESFYRDPSAILRSWQAVSTLLAMGGVDDSALGLVQSTLITIDEGTIDAFVQRLRR